MKILVLIPSKNRDLRLECETGAWLFKSGVDYKILVEPQNMEAYEARFGRDNILELTDNDRGTQFALRYGSGYAQAKGYDVIFKIDDDIKGWTTMDKTDKSTNVERFQALLADAQVPLANEQCGGISFGYRQEFWHDKKWFGVNHRFQTCYLVKTNLYLPRVFEKGEQTDDMWEDFNNFFRVVEKGFKVFRYGRYTMDTDVQSGTGGLQDFYKNRTPEQYRAVIEMVKKEFPWLPWKEKKNGFIEPDLDCPMIGGKKL